jgi:hypothetical protein
MNTNESPRAFQVAAAAAQGRDHLAARKNRQDVALARALQPGLAVGVVCDGCGSGTHTEVGAALLAAAVAASIVRPRGEPLELVSLAHAAVGEAVLLQRHLADRCAPAAERASFVRHVLLATAVGFALRGDEGVLFAFGDGALALGDSIAVIDHGGAPAYPAATIATEGEPVGPGAVFAFDASEVSFVAALSDGAAELPGFVAELRCLAQEGRASAQALERKLLAAAHAGSLRDDGAVAMAWRMPRGVAS